MAFRNVKIQPDMTCAFLHDQFQEAAYKLIDPTQRLQTHLSIGNRLLLSTPEGQKEEKIFDICSHFKIAIELLTEKEERQKVAALFLMVSEYEKEESSTE